MNTYPARLQGEAGLTAYKRGLCMHRGLGACSHGYSGNTEPAMALSPALLSKENDAYVVL